jgi:hypothetical protein
MIGQASHRINPCPLCRPAPAGCQGEGGNGPVAGRLADAGRASGAVSAALAFPDHKRKAQPVPDDATRRSRLPVSGRRTSGTRPPVGCGHHPAIFGPARRLRHPSHVSATAAACTPNPLPNGTACARPSGLSFPKLRRRDARRVSACCTLPLAAHRAALQSAGQALHADRRCARKPIPRPHQGECHAIS